MLFSPRFIFTVVVFLLLVLSVIKIVRSNKKYRKFITKRWSLFLVMIFFVAILAITKVYQAATKSNTYCFTQHKAISTPPAKLLTALDYFERGNYEYDLGNCAKAIEDYSKAIELNPIFPEVYNNRAYTYMMLEQYDQAFLDLDKAIELRPDYVNALMNRGDIYNFYYKIDRQRAIADYDRVLRIDPSMPHHSSVCGHRFLAKHNGWNLGSLLEFPWGMSTGCK